MTRRTPVRRVAAALIATSAIALLTGCTAQPAPATRTTAEPASTHELACPTRAEVAGLTAIPFSDGTSSARLCTYTTASDAGTAAAITLRHPAGGGNLAALRAAAVARGTATRDARTIAFDAYTTTTAQDCTLLFPAADGTPTSVTARRSGASGAEACALATAVATLAGGATTTEQQPTVAVIAPRSLLGTTTADQRWPWSIGQRAGVRIDRLTGTGYLAPSTASASFGSLAGRVPTGSAAVVLVSGTAEAGASSLAVLRGATRTLSEAAARAPKAALVVVGPLSDGTTAEEEVASLRDDLRAAAKIAGARYVDPSALDGTDPAKALAGVAADVAAALRKADVAGA